MSARSRFSRVVVSATSCVDTIDADAAFLAGMPQGRCPRGEGGAFHAVVTGGPSFATTFRVVDGERRRMVSPPRFLPTGFVVRSRAPKARP